MAARLRAREQERTEGSMIHRYAEWTRRHGASAQCHPALGAAGVIIAACITCYIYRQVIITTLLTALAATAAVAAVAACVAIIVSTRRFLRAQRIVALEREPVPDTWTKAEPVTTLTDEEAITEEADWLAGTGSVLVFDKDGNLRAAERK